MMFWKFDFGSWSTPLIPSEFDCMIFGVPSMLGNRLDMLFCIVRALNISICIIDTWSYNIIGISYNNMFHSWCIIRIWRYATCAQVFVGIDALRDHSCKQMHMPSLNTGLPRSLWVIWMIRSACQATMLSPSVSNFCDRWPPPGRKTPYSKTSSKP